MKPIHVVLFLLVAALAGAGGWFAARHALAKSSSPTADTGQARKILYYQSAMHPWIKSDKPGRCTICGMELSPVYDGDKGFDAGEGIVTLGSNIIQVINARTDEVRRRPLKRSLRFAGTIDDNDAKHRIVSAYIDGRVDALAVNFVGAEVVAGQPLATFYSPMLLAAEREYIATAKQHAPPAGATLAAENHRLVEAAGARLKRYGLSEAQVAALPQKEADDIHTQLLAPVSGTVVGRFVYEGQYVKEGDKLFEIADFSTMWFQFDAYERDLAWLKPGQKVEVTTPAAPGKTFTGTLAFIDPNLKEMTRSAKVRVELPNPSVEINGVKRRELYHKLFADAVVQVEIPEVLAVPRSAVLSPGAAPVLYVDKGGGAYEQRRLRLGRTGDDEYEVLDGIAEGERVVTQGGMLIDAQAQLNASANQPTGEGVSSRDFTGTTNGLPPLTDAQQKAVHEFLALANAITAALAGDNLEEFNAQALKAHSAVPSLAGAFATDSPWRPSIEKLEAAAHLAPATDLKAGRKSFHPLSEAVVEFAKALRRQEAVFKSLKIFRCPMTKDAFPGAPRTAEWIQFESPIRNPYFGAEMLDCGSEVK
jgi:membrane fusion protein, copper/silver efflux system